MRVQLTFQSVGRASQVYNALAMRCERAREYMLRTVERPYGSNLIRELCKDCGVLHTLKSSERLMEAQCTDSFFFICEGSLKMRHNKQVHLLPCTLCTWMYTPASITCRQVHLLPNCLPPGDGHTLPCMR